MQAEHFFNFKNERPIVFASALATTMTRYPVVTAKKTPQLDTFRDSIGDEGVLRMTHFTPSEIVGLHVDEVGRWQGEKEHQDGGRRALYDTCVLKTEVIGEFCRRPLELSLLHSRKMIVHFLELLSPHLYALYAEDAVKADSMEKSY
ncbi:hypothetical protein PRNP1_006233 [Phytophthora ramorum]